VTGGELRPASQARPEPFGFGGRRAREEAAVLALGGSDRAYGAAVDARGAHAHEEAPVEPGVVGPEGAVALVGIEEHGRIMGRRQGVRSPFSDVESGASM